MVNIEKAILKKYIAKEQVAWQEWDGVMNVSHGESTPDYEDAVKVILNCNTFNADDREGMLKSSFHSLADWSTKNDVLLLGDDFVLICIPKFLFDKWFEKGGLNG